MNFGVFFIRKKIIRIYAKCFGWKKWNSIFVKMYLFESENDNQNITQMNELNEFLP